MLVVPRATSLPIDSTVVHARMPRVGGSCGRAKTCNSRWPGQLLFFMGSSLYGSTVSPPFSVQSPYLHSPTTLQLFARGAGDRVHAWHLSSEIPLFRRETNGTTRDLAPSPSRRSMYRFTSSLSSSSVYPHFSSSCFRFISFRFSLHFLRIPEISTTITTRNSILYAVNCYRLKESIDNYHGPGYFAVTQIGCVNVRVCSKCSRQRLKQSRVRVRSGCDKSIKRRQRPT